MFVDFEKAFDRVPYKMIWWALRSKNVPERCIKVIQDTYHEVCTSIRAANGAARFFEVKVGAHQGSALNPFIFIMVLDVLTSGIEGPPPWSMLFADDLALADEDIKVVQDMLEK